MTIGFLYKECMHWVSQIQSIRNELERVKTELRITPMDMTDDLERKRLTAEIRALDKNLDAAEAILLASLNNGTTYWAGHSHTYDTPKIEPCENNLFDRMKNIYNSYIELQRAIMKYLSGSTAGSLMDNDVSVILK